MPRTSTGKMEIYIGAFVLAGVIILAGMILSLGGDFALWTDQYVVVVKIDHVSDLQTGAPVKLGGVRIGRVEEIRLEKRYILLIVSVKANVQLTADCEASIENSGIVGDTFLEFIQGQSSDILPQDVESAEEFRARRGEENLVTGNGTVGMNKILSQLREIGAEVIALSRNINEIAGDVEVKRNIKETIANVAETSNQANRLLVSLRKSSENVQIASQHIMDTTRRVQRMSATFESSVNQTLGDKRNIEAVNEGIANIRRVSRSMDSLIGRIDSLVGDEELNFKKTMEDVRVITAKMRGVAESVGPDRGIMRLFTQDEVWQEIVKVSEKLKAYISDKKLLDLLQINKYADVLAQKYLQEMRATRITAEELEQKILEKIRRGLDTEQEARQIIEERGGL